MSANLSSTPISSERVEEIRQLRAGITPGPWKRDRNWHVTGEGHDWDKRWLAPGITHRNFERTNDRRVCHIFGPGEGNNAAADFDFIASAPQIVDDLLTENARLNATLAGVKEYFGSDDLATIGGIIDNMEQALAATDALRDDGERLRVENVNLRGAFVTACEKADAIFDDGDCTVIRVRITRQLFEELAPAAARRPLPGGR